MMVRRNLCLSFLILSMIAPLARARPVRDGSTASRMDYLRKIVEQNLATVEAESAKPDAKPDARQGALYARYILALGLDGAAEKAASSLKRLLPLQEMDTAAPRYGEFAMPEGTTDNSINTEVVLLPLCEMIMSSGDKLPPELRDTIVERIKAGLAALRRRPAPPADSSSAYLMNAVTELLAGEIVRDDKALVEAEARLTNFIAIARTRGVAEYVSPNFTGIQLGVLLSGYQHTTQPNSKRMLEAMVKFVWSQVAANVVPVRGVLGGPHSRDYDFIFGNGTIDWFLFIEGLRPQPPALGAPLGDGLRAYVNALERGFRPDDSMLGLAAAPEPGRDRLVRQRWGAPVGADRYFYVTPDYAIGSSSQVASTHDRKLTVEFPTRKPLPAIWFVADPFDAPYGKVKRAGKIAAPTHIREQIAAVQEKGSLIAMMNLRADMRNQQGIPQSLGSNVLIPLGADSVTVDGKPVPIQQKTPFEMPATLDSTVIVREGTGVVAIKLFAADGAFGHKADVTFKYDGNAGGVARLVAYHYRMAPGEKPRRSEDPIRAGVVYIAASCNNPEDFAAFQKRIAAVKIEVSSEGNVWRGKLIDDQTNLEAALDLKSGVVVTRKVNGEEYQPPISRVNDRDLALDFLAGW